MDDLQDISNAVSILHENLKYSADGRRLVVKPCQKNLDLFDFIICDSCLVWYHFPCTGKSNAPKQHFWFCSKCYKIYSERNFDQKDGTCDENQEVLLVNDAEIVTYIAI